MQTTASQRLTLARKQLGLSMRDFAEPLGVLHGAVNRWENEPEQGLSKIVTMGIEHVHKISADWLQTGEGEMMIDASKTLGLAKPEAALDAVMLPILPLMSLVSKDKEPPVIDWMPLKLDWLHTRIKADLDLLFITQVEDDCMTPTLNPGDIVMVNKVNRDVPLPIFKNGLWLFSLGNAVHIKRLQQTGANQFQALCDNPAYPPMTLKGPLDLIGLIIWADRRF